MVLSSDEDDSSVSGRAEKEDDTPSVVYTLLPRHLERISWMGRVGGFCDFCWPSFEAPYDAFDLENEAEEEDDLQQPQGQTQRGKSDTSRAIVPYAPGCGVKKFDLLFRLSLTSLFMSSH